MPTFERTLSGMPGVDAMVDNIRLGDNVVWQLDNLDQYRRVVGPHVEQAIADGRSLHYIRFADHPPICDGRPGLTIRQFCPEDGFETFALRIHEYIADTGPDAFYIFDSLSELQTAWASDLMMGCFFQVTCPFLFEMNTVAFFGILRNRHTFDALARIRDTTQLFLDVFGDPTTPYIQPIKVWQRYHPAMFSPHRLSADGMRADPVTDPVEAARFHAALSQGGLIPMDGQLDYWDRTFLHARQDFEDGRDSPATCELLAGMLMGKEERFIGLVHRHFSTGDFLRIKERMIGSGAVGGKTAGMLLARKIVENSRPDMAARFEPHDSFYIGSDVFYAFLVENGWWRLRLRQRTEAEFFTAAEELAGCIAGGSFQPAIHDQFRRVLEYFAQTPIIVRSSSLLEDSFGNAFAGKYDSFFLANTGSPDERLAAFEEAVKKVYASSMHPAALAYRRSRGLADSDEQMGILVQRVSGGRFGDWFMPCAAGVGHSINTYVWDERIDPDAGMIRLVAGLGTRAVDRVDTDYPRIVSLNVPAMQPFGDEESVIRHSQRFVDGIDVGGAGLVSLELEEAAAAWPEWLRQLLCRRDYRAEAFYTDRGVDRTVLYCNCESLVVDTTFPADMRAIMACLQDAYAYPVDVEFTVNFSESGEYVVNLLQCRPLQVRGHGLSVAIPETADDQTLFRLQGGTMGGGAEMRLDYVVVVDTRTYERLSLSDKYETARHIGRITAQLRDDGRILLLGPGRWGTRSPDLGVPVSFSEICGIAALGEISMRGGHVEPDLSFGSHFFQDLIEAEIFYAAIMPERDGCIYNPALLAAAPVMPMAGDAPAVAVHDVRPLSLWLKADVASGRCLCASMS